MELCENGEKGGKSSFPFVHAPLYVLFFYFTPGLRNLCSAIAGTNNEFESLEFACITAIPAVKKKAFIRQGKVLQHHVQVLPSTLHGFTGLCGFLPGYDRTNCDRMSKRGARNLF